MSTVLNGFHRFSHQDLRGDRHVCSQTEACGHPFRGHEAQAVNLHRLHRGLSLGGSGWTHHRGRSLLQTQHLGHCYPVQEKWVWHTDTLKRHSSLFEFWTAWTEHQFTATITAAITIITVVTAVKIMIRRKTFESTKKRSHQILHPLTLSFLATTVQIIAICSNYSPDKKTTQFSFLALCNLALLYTLDCVILFTWGPVGKYCKSLDTRKKYLFLKKKTNQNPNHHPLWHFHKSTFIGYF